MSEFDEHYNKAEVLSAIDGIKYPGGGTKTGAALNKAKSELFEKSARAGVPNIAIVITDGKSKDSIRAPAQQLRDSGCTVFSVGIGKNYNKEQLREMATDPDSQHVMKADFDALDTIVETIVGNACKGRCSQSQELLELRFDHFKRSGIVEKLWRTKGSTKSSKKSNAASSHVNIKQKI